jgi:cyclohexyl-isocyanide hydratase
MAETTFTSGFVLFPQLTQLDFTGPLQVLHRLPRSRSVMIAATREPVPSDCGLSLVPTHTFDDCPELDLLCVPGGFGVEQAVREPRLVDFVRERGRRARYVTSVCTGAFVLGAAGLLTGRRATTHWGYHAQLAQVGATPTRGRVVRDGNLFTGGGVTAGIDFALTIAAEIAGEEVARRIQLGIEYDPQPPFDSGAPDRAAPATLAALQERYAERVRALEASLASLPRP